MSFVVDIPGFDLGKSIESGQIFRFAKIEDGVYKIWAKDYVCGMTQVPDGVRVDTMTDSAEEKDFWESWLPKPFDPAELEAIMSTNPVLKEAHEYSKGSYLFRQYPFECLMDFIASQRNSIARISQIMFTLCNICGDLLPDTSFAFPRPEQITREAVLTPRKRVIVQVISTMQRRKLPVGISSWRTIPRTRSHTKQRWHVYKGSPESASR